MNPDKRKAIWRKYGKSPKGRARAKRYRDSAGGKMVIHLCNCNPKTRLAKRIDMQRRRSVIHG